MLVSPRPSLGVSQASSSFPSLSVESPQFGALAPTLTSATLLNPGDGVKWLPLPAVTRMKNGIGFLPDDFRVGSVRCGDAPGVWRVRLR
ncbi:hypothetical protein NDU88_003505 [Pleurodeles waltl]|uniref:Uncharacterized protein n=1 Tax=Pleurodeles waltl TaxID=8319 RepID=A0AAV7WP95_PLEWA|nr:hypothetical protein NDU88_003505 [Pleurodeles waltl]